MLFFIVFLFFVVVCEVYYFFFFSTMEGRWGQFLVFLCFRKEMPLLDFFPLFLTGIMQLMSIPSKKHFLASRLTPDMERKITFLLFQVSCPWPIVAVSSVVLFFDTPLCRLIWL